MAGLKRFVTSENYDFVMTLPKFKVIAKSFPQVGWVSLQCSRPDCKGTFQVEWRRMKATINGRISAPCPYCFRAGRLPLKSIKKPVEPKDSNPGRRKRRLKKHA